MVTEVVVGNDRVLLTAYNPQSELTLLKCVFVLERLQTEWGRIPEARFEEWLATRPGGAEFLAKLRSGWRPLRDRELKIDPRNAREEARIVAYLMAEEQAQMPAGREG